MDFFSRLSVGSKVAAVISALVIVCIAILAFFITTIASKTINQETRFILEQASYRYGNLLHSVTKDVMGTLLTASATINNIIEDSNVITSERLENIVRSVPNNVESIEYVYLYMPDFKGKELIILSKSNHRQGEKADLLEADPKVATFSSVKKTLEAGKPSLSKSVHVEFQGQQHFSQGFGVPIHDKKGKTIGVLGGFVDFDIVGKPLLVERAKIFEGDQRFVIDEEGTIVINQNPDFIGKNLNDVAPTQETKDIIAATKEGKYGIYPYRTAGGVQGLVGINAIEIIEGSNQYWSSIAYVPNSAIEKPIMELLWVIIIGSIATVIVIIFGTIFYLRSSMAKRIHAILGTLTSFFDYLNHKTKELPTLLKIRAKDELGEMGQAINGSIQTAQEGLEQDKKLVAESLKAIERARDGYADTLIECEGSNPALNRLRDSVNDLLKLLQTAIGKDLHELNRVYDSYTQLDFTTEVKDASGRVETTTNTLGEEIRKMLSTSAGFAQTI